LALGIQRALIVTSPPIVRLATPLADALHQGGCAVEVYAGIAEEPSITTFEKTLAAARSAKPQAVVGLGGGSAMDVAKLVAALYGPDAQDVREVLGINLLRSRSLPLACLPTTAGTAARFRRTPSFRRGRRAEDGRQSAPYARCRRRRSASP
jgi:alcohol dehydrogenase class IV